MQDQQYQGFDEFVDEDIRQQEINGQANPKMNGHADQSGSQSEDVYYRFSVSRKSFRDLGRQALKAGETTLQTALAVDDAMERRRQARRQVRRQNMSDGLRVVSFLVDVFT